jgi:hypothetical protein
VLINAFVDHLGIVGPAVLFRREHLNQLAAAVHQGFERLGLRVSQRSGNLGVLAAKIPFRREWHFAANRGAVKAQ